MYDYIFYTLYKYNLKDGTTIARINGSMIVALSLIIHIGLLLAVIKKIIPNFYNSTVTNILPKEKSVGFFIFLIMGLGVFFWYNNSKVKKLLAKQKPIPEYVKTNWDILYVVLLLIIPLIPIMIIFWKG